MTTVPASVRRFVLALFLLPVLVGCAFADEGDPPREVERDDSLAERWARAVEMLGHRPAGETTWIGWSIVRSEQALIMSNTGPASLRGPDGESLAELLGKEADGTRVAFLFAFPPGTEGEEVIVGTRLRSLHAPVDVDGSSLVWLGRADDAESVALLESIFSRVRSPAVRTEFGPMIAVHESAAVTIPALRRIVTGDESERVRAEAVAWLGYQRADPGAEELLLEVLWDEPSYLVLDELLGAIDLERGLNHSTREVLFTLLKEHPDPEARALVAETLGETGDPAAFAALETAAAEDPSARVRREALDSLEDARDR